MTYMKVLYETKFVSFHSSSSIKINPRWQQSIAISFCYSLWAFWSISKRQYYIAYTWLVSSGNFLRMIKVWWVNRNQKKKKNSHKFQPFGISNFFQLSGKWRRGKFKSFLRLIQIRLSMSYESRSFRFTGIKGEKRVLRSWIFCTQVEKSYLTKLIFMLRRNL